jgi:hypothetical protein
MIWAFSQVNADWEDQYWDNIYSSADWPKSLCWELKKPSFDHKGFAKHEQRMVRGFKMFGKYYNSLWD